MTQQQRVSVLVITHEHGTDITVHATDDLALTCLANYCKEWWADLNTTSPPKDDSLLIDEYFQLSQDSMGPGSESYELDSYPVEGRESKTAALLDVAKGALGFLMDDSKSPKRRIALMTALQDAIT